MVLCDEPVLPRVGELPRAGRTILTTDLQQVRCRCAAESRRLPGVALRSSSISGMKWLPTVTPGCASP